MPGSRPARAWFTGGPADNLWPHGGGAPRVPRPRGFAISTPSAAPALPTPPGRLDAFLLARAFLDTVQAPLTLVRKARKVWRDPERFWPEVDPARWLCHAPRPALPSAVGDPRRGPRGPHVVFVGKGYGELRILERLDAGLRLRRHDVRTTWCGKMPEFFAGAARLGEDRPTIPLPFEALPAVQTWLARLRPQVVVFVERVWNSTLAIAATRSGARCLVVNALGWEEPEAGGRVGRWETWARRSVGAAVARHGFTSEQRAARAAPFLPAQAAVSVTGNVKLDLPAPPVTPAVARALEGWLAERGERPLLAAASTRKGDEAFVLEAFAAVRRVRPCALLLAPREPHRVGGLLDLLAQEQWRVSRRRSPSPQADVFLLDTVGELGGVYPHVAAAFIGGTLRHQGQNFVEPLQHAVPVSFGTSEVLLMEEERHCVAAGLGAWVRRPGELAAHWLEVLGRAQAKDGRRQAVDAFLRAHEGALARTVDLVVAELPARRAP